MLKTMTPLARQVLENELQRSGTSRHWQHITGQRYGLVTVVRRADERRVVVRCDCGKTATIRLSSLRQGQTRSCGCLRVETGRRNGRLRRGMTWAKKKAVSQKDAA